jgi:uncharacterized membrane protein YoaK (UPF0700 family)
MLTKPIPIWILLGGFALAGVAGAVNVVGFLSVEHMAVSHVSGTVSNLGLELARGNAPLARHAALAIVFFFLGSVLSGMIVRHSTLRAGRRYGVALTCEAALLFAAAYFLHADVTAGLCLAAMACGLQNALATSYSGAVIRTTHMTGIVTDLGIAIGLTARGERADWRRMRLYLVLLAGFFLGSAVGAWGHLHFGSQVLLFPAVFCGVTGVGFTVVKHYRRHPAHPAARTVSDAPLATGKPRE